MEQSSSHGYDELTVMHQFDRKCRLALDGEVADYEKHLAYLREHEICTMNMAVSITVWTKHCVGNWRQN